jgi:hypothetical protein
MEHFGLSTKGEVEMVYILARVDRLMHKTMRVRPILIKGWTFGRVRELQREMVHTEYFNGNDDALIKIPRIMVAALGLYQYLLSDADVAFYRDKVEKYYR